MRRIFLGRTRNASRSTGTKTAPPHVPDTSPLREAVHRRIRLKSLIQERPPVDRAGRIGKPEAFHLVVLSPTRGSCCDRCLAGGLSTACSLCPVFHLRFRRRLPLHVLGSVGTSARQRHPMVDDVPTARAGSLPGRGTRVLRLEAALGGAAAFYSPTRIASAGAR
jgi:hypothetical protein